MTLDKRDTLFSIRKETIVKRLFYFLGAVVLLVVFGTFVRTYVIDAQERNRQEALKIAERALKE